MTKLKCYIYSLSPIRKGNTGTKRKGSKAFEPSNELARSPVELSRYPVRVVLCAYMILGFLDTVISGNGVHEAALAESAAKFTRDFELLIKIILEGAEDKTTIPCQITFRSQLEAFVKAWCSYLYHFVVWKVKHAKSLEEDLVRAACQLELSVMQTCKPIPEKGDNGAILKQVTEDWELLRTKVQHLSGNAGLERMEFALSDMRSRFLKAKDSGSSSATPFPSISSSVHGEMNNVAEGCESSSPIVHSLSKRNDSSSGKVVGSYNDLNGSAHGHPSFDAMFVGENELLVNEIVHEHRHGFADSFIINDEDKNSLNVGKTKRDNGKAFWDGIMESMKQEEPNFSWVLKLMKEVGDELCEMSLKVGSKRLLMLLILTLILSKVLKLGSLDVPFAYFSSSLPLTRQWLSSVWVVAEEEWDEDRDSQSTMASNARLSQGLPPTTLQTGGSIVVSSKLGSPTFSTTEQCKEERVDLLVRLGLLKLVSEIGGLALETLPETLKINFVRLRAVRSQLQKIIVISTSIQTLLSENLVTSPLDMDNIVSTCVKQLSDLLDSVEDVGVPEIVETISGFPQGCDHVLDVGKLQARKHVMANMLAKSLQAGDPIFARLSRTAYLAVRGAVLGGNGTKGRQLVETALQRLGAALLTGKLMEAAEVLIVVAVVSGNVHGYEEVLNSL